MKDQVRKKLETKFKYKVKNFVYKSPIDNLIVKGSIKLFN